MKIKKNLNVVNVFALVIALAALIISIQTKEDVRWLESIQDNIIERVMFSNE